MALRREQRVLASEGDPIECAMPVAACERIAIQITVTCLKDAGDPAVVVKTGKWEIDEFGERSGGSDAIDIGRALGWAIPRI